MKWKRITLIGVSCIAFASTSFAFGGIESIQAYLNHDIKYTLNNKAWTPKDSDGNTLAPVIVNGTSYLPARAIAEALGSEIQWDDSTKNISIKTTHGTGDINERDQNINKKVNEIKEKLRLGLTQQEVQGLLADKHENAYNNGDLENGSDSYWKYYLFRDPDYTAKDLPDHVIDEEGLKNKKIGAYLFIGWKNNKLHLFSISYVNPKDNKIYLFILNPDGTTSENPVSN
ncbi:stalk domain-containing protein [Paenibacillus rigui]|uniref:Copper amine oxidase-like N-terminal domain-containing protein n=1 Tax=Paenibacillus rigui TaxID=554312 RepID=A0A229UVX5_9BACL|nr:stalk domain-containing protein [Paenibacillus rigui]OXM87548.1 hypothetical protein CF651_04265 [Paenibacillus rigui]